MCSVGGEERQVLADCTAVDLTTADSELMLELDVGVGVGSQPSHGVGPLATQICMLNRDCSGGAFGKSINPSKISHSIPDYFNS